MKEDKNEQLTKPLSVLRKELRENIVNAINSSGIPLIIVSYMLNDIYRQVEETVSQQERMEIEMYERKANNVQE